MDTSTNTSMDEISSRPKAFSGIKESFLCFVGLLFLSPYLQHSLYHTTLFSGLGSSSEKFFALFSVCFLVVLAACLAKPEPFARLTSRREIVLSVSVLTFPVLALLHFSPSFLHGAALALASSVASIAYAVVFVFVAIGALSMLERLSESAGLEKAVAVLSLASAASLALFSTHYNPPYYALVAVAGLSLSGLAQYCCLGLTPNLATRPERAADDANLYSGSRVFYYATCFAAILLHTLLYAMDPALEYLVDAPPSLFSTFFLLVLLGTLALVLSKKTRLSPKLMCLFGISLFVAAFAGMLIVSFSSFTHGNFYTAAGTVLALIRVFKILILAMVLITAKHEMAEFVRSSGLYLLIMYSAPTLFAYTIFPAVSSELLIDVPSHFGALTLGISAILVLVIISFLTSLIFRLGRVRPVPSSEPVDARQAASSKLASRFGLSKRETEVLYYASLGYTDKAIGSKLYISSETAHSHIKRIYVKLEVHSRQELIELVETETLAK